MACPGADSCRDTTSDVGKVTITEEGGKDLDSVDGIREYVTEKLARFSCVSGDREKEPPASDSSSRDFDKTRTTTATAKIKSHNQIDSDVYDFDYLNRGLAVIINNEKFSKSSDFAKRKGSSHDASALKDTFSYLGFDVLLHNNLKAWKMMEVLELAAQKYDHDSADCFVCVVLTHGDETWISDYNNRQGAKVRQDVLFDVNGKIVATKDIIDKFSDQECPGLEGKPRLFFLQACRGKEYDDGTEIRVIRPKSTPPTDRGRGDEMDGGSSIAAGETDVTDATAGDGDDTAHSNQPRRAGLKCMEELDAVDARPCGEPAQDKTDRKGRGKPGVPRIHDVPVSPPPLYEDCLIMYATPPGHYAWRRKKTGSWFVQCLCEILKNPENEKRSLLNVLVKVTGKVARDYQSTNSEDPTTDAKKETPVIECMLVKDIFLTRKK